MRLWAISDLHLAIASNRAALRSLPARPGDWLIVAGDVCESVQMFTEAMQFLAGRFARVLWTPGNHELWLTEGSAGPNSSVAKYAAFVAAARQAGVDTPEDPYPRWPGGPVVVPLFTGFDYSFRPPDISRDAVLAWAAQANCVGADERLIRPAPFPRMDEWCAALCAAAQVRLETEVPADTTTILVNHYPLRRDLVRIPRIPRYTPWCGTVRTENWHVRFRAVLAVSGHLHVRRTDWRDGTRFEEVSLGYARQWDPALGIAAYCRDVTPGPD